LTVCLLVGVVSASDKKQSAPLTDAVIHDQVQVQVKLAEDAIVKGGALVVEVLDGVVTLSGSVQTQKQKTRAGTIAKKVKGVKSVANNITVQP